MDTKTDVLQPNSQYDTVKKYYGEVVQKTSDLKTDACCTTDALPVHIRKVLPLIESEIKNKYYGCGHIAVYTGKLSESPFKFELDDGHVFYKNKPERVCGNTAIMLSGTRFKEYFQISGSFREHFGAFRSQSSI